MKSILPFLSASLLFCATALAENWPQFRGPTGQGLSTETGVPVKWSDSENVIWKTPIAGEAWSSPIVWENRVFVTTALGDGRSCHILCIDRDSGKIHWDKEVLAQDISGRRESRNTFATPTPATDGNRVYTAFFDGSFVAVDYAGSVVWTNRDYKFYSQHGLGSSPILWQGLLMMARDGSSEGENKSVGWQQPWDKSFVVALDAATGKEKWRALRGMSRIAHAVPVIVTSGKETQLISCAGDVVQGFDPRNGERLWSSSNKGEGLVPSPAAGDGLVFTASGFGGRESVRAFKMDGRGDLNESNIAWEQRKGMPRIPSLLYVNSRLYSVTETSLASCLKGDTGEILWQERLGGSFSASPVYADGKVYFLSDAGETVVVAEASQFKVLARNHLKEKCQASIAFSGKQVFIRSERNLFCIGTRLEK